MIHADKYLKSVTNLPPVPTVVNELLTLFKDEDHDIQDVVTVVANEPSLTAQILKICNSAYFAGQEPIGDIFEALTRLGFYEAYCVVVGSFGSSVKSLAGVREGIDIERFWTHSVTTAAAASEIADVVGESRADAFTAGLLHDTGKLIFASVEHARYADLMRATNGFGGDAVDAENTLFQVDHAKLAGLLLARWKLPKEVTTAVRFHHERKLDENLPFSRLVAVVQLADVIAHQVTSEPSAKALVAEIAGPCCHNLKLDPDEYPALVQKTECGLERVQGLVKV